jgi:adenosylcobinamide-GDP ribazoletransferase
VMPPVLRGARAATVFLTRLPVGGFPYSERDFAWASGWFPGVGLLLGVLLGGVWRATGGLGPSAGAVLTLAASLLLTGAFHEDGLADSADALGGGRSRERVLEILKDSRVGTYGASVLILSLALRGALLVRLEQAAPLGLLVSETLSRCGPVWLLRLLPYLTPATTARSGQVARSAAAQVFLATGLSLALLLALAATRALEGTRALAAGLSVFVVTAVCGAYFRRRMGGVTGDFLGAVQQLSSVALLAVLAWR